MTNGKSMRPRFSMVICTRNRANMLGDCIKSLRLQQFDKDRYELIVVDDGSTDGTRKIVESFQSSDAAPGIHYHPQKPSGLNAARNAGVRAASGEIVLFFDDDELAETDYLTRIDSFLERNPDAMGIGGPLKDTGHSTLRACKDCSLAEATISTQNGQEVDYLIGGNMALRAEAFQKVGYFDEEISGRGDETEWFVRAKGHKFLYDPELWVWHRRDNFSLRMLCRHAFVQGLAIPIYMKKTGAQYRVRPLKLLRLWAHAIFHRCAKGAALAARETGGTFAYLKQAALRIGLH